jgi:hypothetical protein
MAWDPGGLIGGQARRVPGSAGVRGIRYTGIRTCRAEVFPKCAWYTPGPDLFGSRLYLAGDVGRPYGPAYPGDSVQDITASPGPARRPRIRARAGKDAAVIGLSHLEAH